MFFVPYPFKEKFENELKRLVKKGIFKFWEYSE